MPLLQVAITLVVVGVILLINSYIPMPRTIKTILNALVSIVVILWLLNVFDVLLPLSGMHAGEIHGRR